MPGTDPQTGRGPAQVEDQVAQRRESEAGRSVVGPGHSQQCEGGCVCVRSAFKVGDAIGSIRTRLRGLDVQAWEARLFPRSTLISSASHTNTHQPCAPPPPPPRLVSPGSHVSGIPSSSFSLPLSLLPFFPSSISSFTSPSNIY